MVVQSRHLLNQKDFFKAKFKKVKPVSQEIIDMMTFIVMTTIVALT